MCESPRLSPIARPLPSHPPPDPPSTSPKSSSTSSLKVVRISCAIHAERKSQPQPGQKIMVTWVRPSAFEGVESFFIKILSQ